MKHLFMIVFIVGVLGIGCNNEGPVEIQSVNFIPSGVITSDATITITASGEGTVTAKWVHQDYFKTSYDTVWREVISVEGSGDYISTYNIHPDTLKGYYSITLYEGTEFLYTSSSRFYGEEPPIVESFIHGTGGNAPYKGVFQITLQQGWPAHCHWDFGGMGLHEADMPGFYETTFTFTEAGTYHVVVQIENPWGKTADTAIISVY